jgi:lysophospholipase L1-like esterase
MLGLVVLATLLTSLVACSPVSEKETQRTGDDPRAGTAHREKTAAPVAWDYVALGDSLAVGVGANRGYVDRYTQHLRSDTGARVEVANLGVSGQTSSQLLATLRNDPSMRRAIGGAEVVTFNIGINDLGHASRSYENRSCGGAEDERCLREAVEVVAGNWDAIVGEILSLRSTEEAVIRTAGLGYTPRVDGVFEPYLAEVNRRIAASAADNGIPYAEVRLGGDGMSSDGVHPNDEGYKLIADKLRNLGYEPLGTRR